MKVEFENVLVPIRTLQLGVAFQHGNDIYLRGYNPASTSSRLSTMRLRDGMLETFDGDVKVRPVKMKVVPDPD